jgi:hypothetical protein
LRSGAGVTPWGCDPRLPGLRFASIRGFPENALHPPEHTRKRRCRGTSSWLTRRHVLPAEASILAEANASLVPLFSQNDIKGIANDARVKLGYCLEQALTPFENPSQLGNLRGGGSIAANHVPRSSWITRPKFDEDVHAPSMIAAGPG